MDDGTALLVFINQQLQQTIIDFKRKLELEAEARSIKQLFHMGCGFTDFLTQMFFLLDLTELQRCRLVCSVWRDFIDEFVWLRHPLVRNFERWTQGFVEHEQVYCGGEVGIVSSDQSRIFCAMKTGSILVFDSTSFLLETVLEGGAGTIWQLQSGRSILAAISEACIVIWKKEDLSIVARIRHGSKGEPYLHVENDLLVVPGDTKYLCRLLLYHRTSGNITGVRDLDHKRYWVLGAYIDGLHLLTLSLFAYGTNTTRELRLWNILDGTCISTVIMGGGVSGFPALRFPFAFLSSPSKGLEIWNMENREKMRSISTSVYGFQLKDQFLFILDKHCKLKVFKIQEVKTCENILESVWCREIVWPVEGPTMGSVPRFTVERARVLAISSSGRARDVIHVVNILP